MLKEKEGEINIQTEIASARKMHKNIFKLKKVQWNLIIVLKMFFFEKKKLRFIISFFDEIFYIFLFLCQSFWFLKCFLCFSLTLLSETTILFLYLLLSYF